MATAKMTLIGMYNYDNTIFNDMFFPEGIEKDLVISSLLMQGGEFEVLYPDPYFMKNSIKIWSSKWYRTFAEWLKGTQAEWNPIYNYDRYEVAQDDANKKYNSKTTADYTDKRTANISEETSTDFEDKRTADLTDKRTTDLTDEKTLDLSDSRTADLTDKNTFNNTDTTSQTENSTTEHLVAGYDSSTYQPSSKDEIDNGVSKLDHTGTVTTDHTGTDSTAHTGTDTDKHTGTDTMDHTGTDTMEHKGTDSVKTTGTDTMDHTGTLSDVGGSEQNKNLHTAHMYGNIGVTTSASMLREFYDIARWNLYEHINDVFISELLIPVY